jgi:4-amino-4-deoxy-L-arabinose transferase-like glycosyltransferase
VARGWPLLAVLAVQAALSLRLVWSSTAFQDEALFLRAGHLEWAHWLHHAPIPRFPGYFSGAPVLYPPLGAVADSVGGLAAARALSLGLMLGVTGLLWASAGRLYGRRAALLAAGLFATLAGTQFLGAFATFDAMALSLLALATWLGVRGADRQPRTRVPLLIASGATLAVADAVKYATVLFTPVVLAVAVLAVWRQRGCRAGLAAGLTVLGSWLAVAAAGIITGGREYWRGITANLLARSPSNIPVSLILHRAYVWTSLILVLAVLGVLLASRFETRGKLLPAALAAAGFLAPAAQARLHTAVSLQKNVVFGAWFAAIAAGYAMARISRVDPGHGWAAVMALPIAASTLFASMGQATSLYAAWPNSAALISVLRSDIPAHPGHYLAENDDVEAYYLRSDAAWQRWSDAYQASPAGGGPYAAAIGRHYFSLVILAAGGPAAVSQQIAADLRRAGGYHVLARPGRYTIWVAAPAGPSRLAGRAHARL